LKRAVPPPAALGEKPWKNNPPHRPMKASSANCVSAGNFEDGHKLPPWG